MSALMGDHDTLGKRFLGSFMTKWRSTANSEAAKGTIGGPLANIGINIMRSDIPLDDRVETANRGAIKGDVRMIFGLAKQLGPAAKAYDDLAREIITDVERREAEANRQQGH